MENKNKINQLIEKYQLKGKSIDELQKLIGDSDRGCMKPYEIEYLEGDNFIDKAESLFYYVQFKN